MVAWPTVPIGELFRLKQGTYLKPEEMEQEQTDAFPFPVYGANGVIGYSNRKMYSERTTLVSCRGANCGVVHYTVPNVRISNNSIACVPTAEIDPTFYYYVCLNTNFGDVITGSAQPQITITNLSSKKFIKPSLQVQRRIAGILSAYDELMANSQRRIRILEAMAHALYREWFVQFRFPGQEKVPRVASALGDIPKGWEVKSLADLMDIRGGSQPPKSAFVYEPQEDYIRLIQIRDYESDSHLTFVRKSPKLRLCGRTDIMIARYGASVARICSGLDGAYNVALAKVIPTIPHCQEFLRQFVSDNEFQKLLIGMSGRAAQNGFNKSDIAAVRVAVPTGSNLLQRFERFAVPIRDSILVLHDKIQNLRRMRDLLLPRLLSGQIDFGEAEERQAAA